MSGFIRQWAVRMPNGELFSDPTTQPKTVDDLTIPSPLRDMYMTLGLVKGTSQEQKPAMKGPKVFDRREDAEKLCDELREQASRVGVSNWGGAVVRRLCTPFTSGDPAVEFVAELTAWMEAHGQGGSR